MTMIFDGKAFAREIEATLRLRLRSGVGVPKIISVVVGDDPASVLYTKLKQQAAERVGIEFEIRHDFENLEMIGKREDVDGVMVQLPLPKGLRGETPKLLTAIPLGKDVDGLRWEESGIKPATVRAVFAILDKIAESQIINSLPELLRKTMQAGQILQLGKYIVVGARGVVGRPLVHFLRERGEEVSEVEWDTHAPARTVLAGDVVISCVGKAGVVTGEMVKEGVIAIDVGSPMGDMRQEVYDKASVAVAVPGGVGPVTIACLLQNALDLI